MQIIVTGGAGFLGSRVIRSLLQAQDAGRLPVPVDSVVSLDLAPCPVEDPRVSSRVGDMADPAVLAEAITADTAGIFHLAAVLSGGAEQDFNLALRVNVDATERLLEAGVSWRIYQDMADNFTDNPLAGFRAFRDRAGTRPVAARREKGCDRPG